MFRLPTRAILLLGGQAFLHFNTNNHIMKPEFLEQAVKFVEGL